MYSFKIPLMFFQCLIFTPTMDDTISGFKFEQPTIILVEHYKRVDLSNLEFSMCVNDFTIQSNDHSLVYFTGNITFNATYGRGFMETKK